MDPTGPRLCDLNEDERICLETLRTSPNLLQSLMQSKWSPTNPVDLRIWVPVFLRFETEIGSHLKRLPGLLSNAKRDVNVSYDESEQLILEILRFLGRLLAWGLHRKAFSHYAELSHLLLARNEQIMIATLDVLNGLYGLGGNLWRHRTVSTRFFRIPKESMPTMDKYFPVSETLLKIYEGGGEDDEELETAEEENVAASNLEEAKMQVDEDDASSQRSRRSVPASLEGELSDLRKICEQFDAIAESIPNFSYAKDGFDLLLKERRRRSKSFFMRTRVLAATVMLTHNSVHFHIPKIQWVRDACFVLFSCPVKRDEELVAAGKVLEIVSTTSTKTITQALASKVSGRGVLVTSMRKIMSEADASPETRLGLSFARVVEKKSTKQFWLNLETQLVLCAFLSTSDSGLSALLDGGVVRAVLSWLKRELNEDDDDDEDKFFALSAACFFYMSVAISHPQVIQPSSDAEVFINGCARLVTRILSRGERLPKFGEKTVICSLVWAISCASQALRRSAPASSRLPPFLLTSEDSPHLSQLITTIVDNSLKLGGGVVRCTAEFLVEIARGLLTDQVLRSPVGTSVFAFLTDFNDKCPAEDTEALFATPKYYLTLLRRCSFGRSEIARIDPFIKLFRTFQQPRFFSALAHGWNDVGQSLREFLNDASDLTTQCVEDLKIALAEIDALTDMEHKVIATFHTLRCAAEIFTVKDVATQFLNTDGLRLIFAATRATDERKMSKRTLDLLAACLRSLTAVGRKETMDALSAYIVEVEKEPFVRESPQGFEYMECLCDFLTTVTSNVPLRFSRSELFASDITMQALQALLNWDNDCANPSRAYTKCLAQLLHNLRAGQASMGLGSSSRGGVGRTVNEQRLYAYVVSSVQKVVDNTKRDPQRALARASMLISGAGAAVDEVIRRLYASSTAFTLIQTACATLNTGTYCRNAAKILAIFAHNEVMKEADWSEAGGKEGQACAAFELRVSVLKHLVDVDMSKLSDASLAELLFTVVGPLVNHENTWKRPKKPAPGVSAVAVSEAAKPQKKEFVADKNIVKSLVDMGFHVAHIQAAQEQLRSNDMQQISLYLLENPRPITEEDELKFAVWLSMSEESDQQEGASSEADAVEKSKLEEPALSPEELKEKQDIETEEAHNMEMVERLKISAVHSCAGFGTRRAVVNLPFEAVVARKMSNHRDRPQLLNMMPTIVYFTNLTSDAVFVESSHSTDVPSTAASASCRVIVAPKDRVTVPTYVGNLLVLRKAPNLGSGEDAAMTTSSLPEEDANHKDAASKSIIGCVEARMSYLDVVIPESFDFSVERKLLEVQPILHTLSIDPSSSLTNENARPVLFVNELDQKVVCTRSWMPSDDHESGAQTSERENSRTFYLEPGETVRRPYMEGVVWHFATYPNFENLGSIAIPPRASGFAKQTGTRDPVEYIVSLPERKFDRESPTAPQIQVVADTLASMIVKKSKDSHNEKVRPTYMVATLKENVMLLAHLIPSLDFEEWAGEALEDLVHVLLTRIGVLKVDSAATEHFKSKDKAAKPHVEGNMLMISGKKRDAKEADLMDIVTERNPENVADESLAAPKDGVDHTADFGSKSKKKAQSSLFNHSEENGCDDPSRAYALAVLNQLRQKNNEHAHKFDNVLPDKSVFRKLAESLNTFNVIELEEVFHLLTETPDVLSLRGIFECIQIHGQITAAPAHIESLLSVPEDQVYQYRLTAYQTFKRLQRKAYASFVKHQQHQQNRIATSASSSATASSATGTAGASTAAASAQVPGQQQQQTPATSVFRTKISMDSFLAELDMKKPFDNDAFTQAVKPLLVIDPSTGEITDCLRPTIDEKGGKALAEEFVELVDESFVSHKGIAPILAKVCKSLPRIVLAVSGRTSLLMKILGRLSEDHSQGATEAQMLWGLWVVDVVRLCAMYSESANQLIAREVVRHLREARTYTHVYLIVFVLLASSLRVLIACEKEGITAAVVQKVTEASGTPFASSDNFSRLLILFNFLVSRGVREALDKVQSEHESALYLDLDYGHVSEILKMMLGEVDSSEEMEDETMEAAAAFGDDFHEVLFGGGAGSATTTRIDHPFGNFAPIPPPRRGAVSIHRSASGFVVGQGQSGAVEMSFVPHVLGQTVGLDQHTMELLGGTGVTIHMHGNAMGANIARFLSSASDDEVARRVDGASSDSADPWLRLLAGSSRVSSTQAPSTATIRALGLPRISSTGTDAVPGEREQRQRFDERRRELRDALLASAASSAQQAASQAEPLEPGRTNSSSASPNAGTEEEKSREQ